jgi:hypothetical protein
MRGTQNVVQIEFISLLANQLGTQIGKTSKWVKDRTRGRAVIHIKSMPARTYPLLPRKTNPMVRWCMGMRVDLITVIGRMNTTSHISTG